MPDRTLTLKEAADRAGVTAATLRRWASSDVIPEMSGRVKLKGFDDPVQLCRAAMPA